MTTSSGRYRAIALLILPSLALLTVFQLWPVFEALRLSLTDYNLLRGSGEFVGINNYSQALGDPIFRLSVWNSLSFFLLKVPLELVLGFLLALLVRRPSPGVGVLRSVVLIPTVTSIVVVSTIWGLMYDPTSGLLNGILRTAGLPPQAFLNSPQEALPSIAAMMIWKDVGFTMVFFLAGLNAIPDEYYEAAAIDGAGRVALIRHLTLPLLKPTIAFVLVVDTIGAFKVFTPILLLTKGGPSNATRVIVEYIYDNAFRFNRMGYAVAMAVLLALILVVLSVVQLRTSREAGVDHG